jgi:hypothetical protein
MMPFNLIERVKNMTRETRLGLVVSCSFLGLLGAVLVMKMTEPPEDEQAAATAHNEETPPAPPDTPADLAPPSAGDPAREQSALPSKAGQPNKLPPSIILAGGPTASPAGAPGKPADPPLPPLPPSQENQLTGNKKPAAKTPPPVTDDGLPAIPAAAPPAAAPAVTDALPPVGGRKFWSSLWDTARETTVAAVQNAPKKDPDRTGENKPLVRADTGGLPVLPDQGGYKPPAPAAPPGPKPPDAAPQPPIPPAAGAGGGPTTGEPMRPAKAGEAGPRADGGGVLPPLPAAPVPADDTKDDKKTGTPPPPAPPPIDPPSGGGAGSSSAGGTTSPAERLHPTPAAPLPPVPPAGAGAGGSTGPATPPPAPVKPPVDPPTIEVPPAAPKAAAPAGGLPPVKEPEPIPVGRTPGAAVPALPVPSSPGSVVRAAQPEVVSYTEETYVANAGDTFASISRAKYRTDAYARALYLFNRSHPLAGDELLQSDALKAKQPVYVPPKEILQSRYPDAVGDAKGSGVTVGSTSQRASTPAARTYRVGAGGEKVYDIATKVLGDGNRWVEIRDLNPGWNPELPIPAGIALRLPQ